MTKELIFNTMTGELEYMGYSISIEHNIGYEADYSYPYVEYVATKIDGKGLNVVEGSLNSLFSAIELCEDSDKGN